MMHGHEKSDLAIVAGKLANKAEQSAAESWSERRGPRGMRASKARTGKSRPEPPTAIDYRSGRGISDATAEVHRGAWRRSRGDICSVCWIDLRQG